MVFLAFAEIIPLRLFEKKTKKQRYESWFASEAGVLTKKEKVILPVVDAIRRGAGVVTSVDDVLKQEHFKTKNTFLTGRTVHSQVPTVSYDPFISPELAEIAEETQMSFRGRFWTEWNVNITQEFQELTPTNNSLDQPVNMDTTMFNQKQGQDAGTIIVTIPQST